jgi:hypothetical protein
MRRRLRSSRCHRRSRTPGCRGLVRQTGTYASTSVESLPFPMQRSVAPSDVIGLRNWKSRVAVVRKRSRHGHRFRSNTSVSFDTLTHVSQETRPPSRPSTGQEHPPDTLVKARNRVISLRSVLAGAKARPRRGGKGTRGVRDLGDHELGRGGPRPRVVPFVLTGACQVARDVRRAARAGLGERMTRHGSHGRRVLKRTERAS